MNPFILHDLRAGTIHGSDLSKVLPKTKLNETLYAFANLPFVAIFVFFSYQHNQIRDGKADKSKNF